MALRDRLLGTKRGYAWFRRVVRADRSMRRILDEYVHPTADQVIVDLGCGTGELADMLASGVNYIGIDNNASYLRNNVVSKHGHGSQRFIDADLADIADLELPPIDVAVAIGVLHHLSDAAVTVMLRSIAPHLAPGGRLVTVDPVFAPHQATSARLMMALDRGRFVRQPEHYEYLVRGVFPSATCELRDDLNAFPYTHIVFETGDQHQESC